MKEYLTKKLAKLLIRVLSNVEHMSSEHGLTLLDSELDEISHHCKILTGAEYWENRALAAEKLIEMEPSDPKTYDEFCRIRNEWHELKNQEPPPY